MSLVNCLVNFGLIRLYQNYQIQWNYIHKFEKYNAYNTICNEKLEKTNKINWRPNVVMEGSLADNVKKSTIFMSSVRWYIPFFWQVLRFLSKNILCRIQINISNNSYSFWKHRWKKWAWIIKVCLNSTLFIN